MESSREYSSKDYIRFLSRDKEFSRAAYAPEQDFYACVSDGNLEKTASLTAEPFSSKEGLGQLSRDPLRNLRYHLVISCSQIARGCIAKGMELSLSYDLSDFYINQADLAESIADLDRIHTAMCLDYSRRMHRLRQHPAHTRLVMSSVNYIYENLNTRIRLEDLAAFVHVTPEHLSRLFKKETGLTVSAFILERKLETAANMLQYSDLPVAEIASILAFTDQSYFTKKFREHLQKTPTEYRNFYSVA